ncbi:MAG TPA: hypothetical protein VF961_03210 [Pyrinomonadaceae bacterium]
MELVITVNAVASLLLASVFPTGDTLELTSLSAALSAANARHTLGLLAEASVAFLTTLTSFTNALSARVSFSSASFNGLSSAGLSVPFFASALLIVIIALIDSAMSPAAFAAGLYGEVSGGGPPLHLKEKDVNTNSSNKPVSTAFDFI